MRYIVRWCSVGLAAGIVLLAPLSAAGLAVPPTPTTAPVLDLAKVLDETTEQRIATTLRIYEDQTGNQLAVLTVPSLEGEDIAGYANRVARQWGVGDKKANNGALLLAAIQDRTVRIEVGRGLEPALTDLQANLIIRQEITPLYKQGNYNGGTENGVNAMIRVIGGERLSEPKSAAPNAEALVSLLYFIFVPLAYLGAYVARTRSWWLGGVLGAIPGGALMLRSVAAGLVVLAAGSFVGFILDYLLSKNYRERKESGNDTGFWGSGGGFFGGTGGFGGGSSGGWGGFGGGSFGGGGSSGKW